MIICILCGVCNNISQALYIFNKERRIAGHGKYSFVPQNTAQESEIVGERWFPGAEYVDETIAGAMKAGMRAYS